MLELSPACPGPNYSHIVHSPEGFSPTGPQLNYITDIVLELKAELVKIKTEVKELKKQVSIIHLSLVNELRHSRKNLLLVLVLNFSINILSETQDKDFISSARDKNPKEVGKNQLKN